MRVLVDTCVWTRFLRKGSKDDPAAVELEQLIRADAVQMLGPVRQELLSGAQPRERFERVRDYLRYYPNLRLDEDDDECAAEYYNICRCNGVQATSTELVICAVAVRHQLKIFTTDGDFTRYQEYLPIKLHRTR